MKNLLYYEVFSILLLLVLKTSSRGVYCSSLMRKDLMNKSEDFEASTASEYSDNSMGKGIQQLHQDQLDTQELVNTLADEVKDIKKYLRELLPTDCYAAKLRGIWKKKTLISPPGLAPQHVLCDQHTSGGGWTVVLHRQPGGHNRESFNRTWNTYKSHFGSLNGEFWIGLDVLHALTAETSYELLINVIEDGNRHSSSKQAVWKTFRVGAEDDNYTLTIRDYQSGDSQIFDAMEHHNGKPFSTFDKDNDPYHKHCGREHGGGWWYTKCHHAMLTGDPTTAHKSMMHGIRWFNKPSRSFLNLSHATMMIRPRLPQ